MLQIIKTKKERYISTYYKYIYTYTVSTYTTTIYAKHRLLGVNVAMKVSVKYVPLCKSRSSDVGIYSSLH